MKAAINHSAILLAGTLFIAAQQGSAADAGAMPTDHEDAHALEAAAEGEIIRGKGVVQKIDAENGTVTLAHEPIPELNWPAMTMPFNVTGNAAARIKVGQKVDFELSGEGTDMAVSKMEVSE